MGGGFAGGMGGRLGVVTGGGFRSLCVAELGWNTHLLRSLEDLHHRETQVCLSAWAAGLDLSKTRTYLHDHPEHLDDDERRTSQHLIDLQDRLLGPAAQLDGEPCPDFATLPIPEQTKIVRTRLRAIAKSRTQWLGRQTD